MRAAALAEKEAQREAATQAPPEPRTTEPLRYVTRVNKGSINMLKWQMDLNAMWEEGYRLHTAFEQDGNTVQVFERRD